MNTTTTLLDTARDIARQPVEAAHSLPFACYTCPDIHTLERERIFHRDWVFVCAERELPNTGDYIALDIAQEPIFVARAADGKLRALSNICRHRGTPLHEVGMGNTRNSICPYHAWTYDHTGKLLGMPQVDASQIDKEQHCLPTFNLEIWNGLVFVNISGTAEPLASRYADIQPYLDVFDVASFQHAYNEPPEHWDCNWKLAMENAMESYHLFKVHKNTLETVTPTRDAFYLHGCADWTLTGGKMHNMETGIERMSGKLMNWLTNDSYKKFENYILISLPPSFVGILTYGQLGWISIHPDSSTACTVRSAGIGTSASGASSDEQDFTAAFFAEDKAICERVQRGMAAQHSTGGKLVDIERVVVDFHNWWGNRLFDTPTHPPHSSPEHVQVFLGEFG